MLKFRIENVLSSPFPLILAALLLCSNLQAQEIAGTYAIKNLESGKLLRPKDASRKDGAPIVLYTPTNWKCLTWDFRHVEGDAYQLENLFSSKTFHPGGDIKEGVLLDQEPLVEGKDDQVWEFLGQDKEAYRIRLKGTDLYLTSSESGETNSRVFLAEMREGKAQLWTIYPQDPAF